MKIPKPEDILYLIKKSPVPIGKRDICNAFQIKGEAQRIVVKNILRNLEDEGHITRVDGKTYRIADALPAVCVIEVSEIDIDGDLLAVPDAWDFDAKGAPPRIEISPSHKGHHDLMVGDKASARLTRTDDNIYEAVIIKKIDITANRVVGHIKPAKNGYLLSPIDRRAKYDFDLPSTALNGAQVGQIVVAEVSSSNINSRQKVKVVEVVGYADDPKVISLMALYESGLRPFFPEDVMNATKDMVVPPLGDRTDLRGIPLVTIDGRDARDFDDAVFAEPDTSPNNPNGYHLVVAIADVAHYVRSKSVLDKEAYLRGNSTYFPDRVLPMLPEGLSNDLCSLRPHEPRATLAVHMWIDENGKLLRYKFVRGLMLSRARLTYEQVQDAVDGRTDDTTAPLMDSVINPLYAAWKVLDRARVKRGALDLDIPERKIVVNDKGEMTGVALRPRFDAHKVIEEFMILANVAAATALEEKNVPCVYRIHDRPTGDKLMAARTFLEAFGLNLPKQGVATPAQINHVLTKAKELPTGFLISTIILRSQSQAVYHPENIGHFGLALTRYAHFTSPIRRYADLLIHRALIKAFNLGDDGLSDTEMVRLEEMAEHISTTERASAEAERNSVDRFTAAFLRDKVGTEFVGRISGVTRFGLFVKLDDTGADGLVPIRSLPSDYYVHDEAQHAIVGKRTGRVFRLGATVLTRIVEADVITGSTVFELVNGEAGAEVVGYKAKANSYSPRGFAPSRGKTEQRRKNFSDKKFDKKKDDKKDTKKLPPKAKGKKPPKNMGAKGKNTRKFDD